jgi:hypothetical protein
MIGLFGAQDATAVRVSRGAGGPPPGLTTKGRLVWHLEALLRQTFGNQAICTWVRAPLTVWDFRATPCTPFASYDPYRYVFAHARGSRFHVSSRAPTNMVFGNYPLMILIGGRATACDASEQYFLIDYADGAGLSPDCLQPYNTLKSRTLLDRSGWHDRSFATRPLKVGRFWILALIYSCTPRAPGRLAVQVWPQGKRRPILAGSTNGRRTDQTEYLLYRPGRYSLRVRITGDRGDCQWNVNVQSD